MARRDLGVAGRREGALAVHLDGLEPVAERLERRRCAARRDGEPPGERDLLTNPHRWLVKLPPACRTRGPLRPARPALPSHAFGPRLAPNTSPGGSPSRRAAQRRRSRRSAATGSSPSRWTASAPSRRPATPRSLRAMPRPSASSPTSTPTWWPASPEHACSRTWPPARALTPTGQAGNYPVLLVDGVVGGVWHHRRSGQRVEITVEPIRPLTAPQRRDLEADAAMSAECSRPSRCWRSAR